MVSSGLLFFFDGCGLAVGPGGVFVVEAFVFKATMQDAHEPVGEGSEGLVLVGRLWLGVGRRTVASRGFG